MIRINQLEKAYGSRPVLKGLDLEIPKAKTVALLGANGAGKSTLINILSGLIPFDQGQIFIDGLPHRAFFGEAKNKAKIGIVPQETALYGTLTVEQNLAFWAKLYGLSSKEVKGRIRYYLGLLELEALQKVKVETLSIGQQKIISLLAGMLHDPEILFLDEPTVGIDILHKEKIYAFIRELKTRGITIIYTTHNFAEIPKICDEIAILKDGQIRDYGTEQELIEKYELNHSVEIYTQQQFYTIDDPALASLRIQEGLELELKAPDILVVYGRESGRALPEIIRGLHAQQVTITNLQIQQPSLENIFIEAHNH